MNFLADENVDQQIVDRLREDGHNVLYVAELAPGISDDAVFVQANQQESLLLTADKDFGELVFRQNRIAQGVILIRLAGLSPIAKALDVSAVIHAHARELSSAFTVISPGLVRIRPKL